ncbi:Xaa-Pro aminopeptidase [Bacterioplanes sanyensis]|uniref:Xaa-Pro aminopeptidase n=1 Tax=Bacterioplanes sanyensis TaxID=1249553 RepID=A0A222FG67_9GAMM|nr:Xaa-Pro aminopeptidase [Bacterioplanes sanyensis]ASP37760.1 Xaa-Pro aminopeptidase [Bacterioplanes sanyensis]
MTLPHSEFQRRREQLMAHMAANSIAIVPAAPMTHRNSDVEHPYRQDSDFYYLSGFNEANAVVVLIPGREHGEYVLFCEEKDPAKEVWEGRRVGPDAAPQQLGCDDAFPIADIDEILPGLLEGKDRIYASLGVSADFDQQLMHWVKRIKHLSRGSGAPHEFSALDHLLHEQRLIKSPAEIEMMAKAGDITARAHTRAMQRVRPGLREYQLEAELMHTFMDAGAGWAYPSIVGAGDNACILHYTANNAEIQDGDLVLIDAGCELDYYAADVTRTFPANGRFSAPQRTLYELVLAAQLAAFEQVKPGNHWDQPHQAAVDVLAKGLIELGLLQDELEQVLEEQSYRRFFMHKTGHWIGMDVHDVGDYRVDGEWRMLEPGMVLTIEPGLYIAPDDLTVAEQWRGIGIRIEDDVAVTPGGYRNLTAAVVKSADEIERLIQGL